MYIVDPWGLTAEVTGMAPACFNPLDWIDPGSPDASENAMMLADSLVVPPPGGSKDPFWDEDAKALLMGLILHVASAHEETGQRHLGRVRDLLMLNALRRRLLDEERPVRRRTRQILIRKDQHCGA